MFLSNVALDSVLSKEVTTWHLACSNFWNVHCDGFQKRKERQTRALMADALGQMIGTYDVGDKALQVDAWSADAQLG